MHNGILVVNKPRGMTSHDVVDLVRRKLGVRKVGHAGTLDPEATGVLVVLVGSCTRLFDTFLSYDKEYVATLTLGTKTSSGDAAGRVLDTRDYSHVREETAAGVMRTYVGEIMQTPPMVSALKHKGKRLYKLARQGKDVERTPRKVNIKELKLLNFSLPEIRFYLKCSRGTYVRQLAEDIAADLGCVGHVSSIERVSIGPFDLKSCVSLEDIEASKIRPFYKTGAVPCFSR
ncbi:MAG: tRNA pseudouridine(55) synthase TruB [Candidatus Omnitrophica bacterium]|nr:tRNA pseudouridine(55) synthase TruB [Candidatus Omnitrophota bacterium]